MGIPRAHGGDFNFPFDDLKFQYSSQIERCIAAGNLRIGRLLHCRLLKTSLNLHTFLGNRLVDMYAKCGFLGCAQAAFDDLPAKNGHSWNTLLFGFARDGRFDSATKLLDEMPEPNIVSYNSMISQLMAHGKHKRAMDMFRRMQREYCGGVLMDRYTVVGVACACAGLGNLRLLRQVHGVFVSIGLEVNQLMHNTMIDAYGKCGDPDGSHQLFKQMPVRDIVSCTSLLRAYMCAGRLDEACSMFDGIPERNVVSWTALISGHVQNGHAERALELFVRMMEEGTSPNQFTFVTVLSACADLALIVPGKQVHAHLLRSLDEDLMSDVFVCNALIDMYTKCGYMGSAMALFEVMTKRDVVSWNSVITGFAQHGKGRQSVDIFERMRRSSVVPNHVTFLGVLSACNHSGLVNQGRHYFDLMEKEYGLCPKREHYAAVVDLLGRSCQLEEAMNLIEQMPHGSGLNDVRCWGALLAACRIHGNVELGRRAAEYLFKLEPLNVGRYVMLSNVYASIGQWDNSKKLRRLLKDKGLVKEPGCSWIELGNSRHTFLSKDKSHPRSAEIYLMLSNLIDQMKEFGYSSYYTDTLYFYT